MNARAQGRPATEKRGRTRGMASALVVAVAVGGLGYAAVRSEGETVHRSDLDDGGVWVTSAQQARFGRLNTAIKQLDAGVAADVAEDTSIDVLQDESAVVGVSAGNQLVPIDTRTAQASTSSTAAPAAGSGTELRVYEPATVDMRGGTMAMVEPKTGKVWASRFDPAEGVRDLSGLTTTSKPLATVGGVAALAVGVDGAVHVVSGQTGKVATIPVDAEGALGKPTTTTIEGLEAKAVDITAVGSTWVVYDPTKDALHVAGKDEPVTGAGGGVSGEGGVAYAALQVPGPEAESVGIAGQAQASRAPLGDADVGPGIQLGDQSAGAPAKVSRPVVTGGCLHAAWAASGRAYYGADCSQGGDDASPVPTVQLERPKGEEVRAGVKFRQNRRQLVLNDLDTGGVWDLSQAPQRIDNWDSLVQPKRQDDTKKKDENLVDDILLKQPPKAQPDNLTVRAGTTSKLHVLDNDTDTSGSILAISPKDLTQPSGDDASASVSGDSQSIDVTVADGADGGSFELTYKANNGKATSEKAVVKVRVVGDDVNSPPALRPGKKTLSETTYPVPPGQRVGMSVLGDWRDPESDPVTLEAVDPESLVDGSGKLTVVGSDETGKREVAYRVDDGHGGRSDGKAKVNVIDPVDGKLVAPKTQPDVVRAVLGKPVQIEPLANDVPGADPSDPQAGMQLASEITSKGEVTVDTDLDTGVVTITPNTAGVHELSYAARVGGGVNPGRIRIDVEAAPDQDAPPVAVPDAATVRDQAPTMVDVLANDYSPRSDVLVTRSVDIAGASSWLRPTIYQGRWVRLEATSPAPLDSAEEPRTGRVTYTVSDGTKTARATISVVQKPPLAQELPVVEDDEAIVRAGDTVTVPVLDNDTMSSGVPLAVVPGSVKVLTGKGDAFASGNLVRYVPPSTVTSEQQVVLEYAAQPEGVVALAQTARVRVRVMPEPTEVMPNRAPAARSFSASVVAGERLTITVPTSGVDPDGDSVTIAGVVGEGGDTIDLTRGRITSVGASTIVYEAYPKEAGTEVITYEVADRFGASSQGYVRVGVVQPGDPQPPVAVLDEVVAQPGRTVNVSILKNDLIARGDSVNVEYKDLNAPDKLTGWTVDEESYEVRTKAPEPGAPVHQLTYGIDNGIFDPSRASVLVRGQEGWINPPTAVDDVAKPEPEKTTADVDVLVNDHDIDSEPGQLRIDRVLSEHARVLAGKVQVDILDHPHVVPYVIQDSDEAEAMALIYVPTGDDGKPFLVPDKVVEMDADSSEQVEINDYVKSPRDREVAITAAATVSASPEEHLTFEVTGTDSVKLTSKNGYVGPAALMLEVSDQQSDAQSTAEEKDFGTAYVTIPVQIGPKVPLLRCPVGFDVQLFAGGRARDIDIPSLCHAWVPIGTSLADAQFEARWDDEPRGVRTEQTGDGGRRVIMQAERSAPGATSILVVRAKGAPEAEQGSIGVQVIPIEPEPDRVRGGDEENEDDEDQAQADERDEPEPHVPLPRLRPVAIQGLQEGDSQTIDLRGYLESPLEAPECSIESADVESGDGLSATASGCELTVAAGERPSRTGSIILRVTDGPDRAAIGRATVTMLGRPSAPTGVSASADRDSGGQASVRFAPPTYNGGSPVTGYEVSWEGGSTTCTASPCTITGLTNGQEYRFTVMAVNSVGEGEKSQPSNAVTPDTRPGAVTGTRMASRGDGYVEVAWAGVENKGSAPIRYTVRAVDAAGKVTTQSVAAPSTGPVRVGGLDNNQVQNVQVQAINSAGAGPFGTAVAMQSAGTPPAVPTPSITARGATAADDSAALQISWPAVSANGPPLTQYSLYRRAAGGAWALVTTTSPQATSASTTVPYDGNTYEFVVTATNGAGNTSPQANPASFSSNGIPANPTVSASTPAADYKARWVVTLGSSRSSGYSAIRWSTSRGASGTYSCGPCSGQVTIASPALSSAAAQEGPETVTVTAVNAAGKSSNTATSNQFTVYGPTLEPTNGRGSSTNGSTQVSFSWNNPRNGRALNAQQVEVLQPAGQARTINRGVGNSINLDANGYDRNVVIRVRNQSAAGWSPWHRISVRSGSAPPPPPAAITRVWRGESFYGSGGDCAGNTRCHKPAFSIENFKPGTYGLRCAVNGSSTWFWNQDNRVLVTGPSSWEWNGNWCGATQNNSTMRIQLYGPSGTITSGWHPW
ncbi:fibronectin type III domain-containing protein [Janibacter sp. YIM B02568]|uniref:fibronectin type III domain-containing protein n=1 Tax=Janibacter endophyticus TaxID=2806261 RepID=UPI00194F8F62|nr:fibronectin type III domain-containing protein [Janibacter endophyticus]MBM6544933.1 fibronectin type III domain-containing protein [Janibacter endophyticus]